MYLCLTKKHEGMSTIEQPPKINEEDKLKALLQQPDEETVRLIEALNDEYVYWDKVKYAKRPAGWTAEKLWTYIKAWRMKNTVPVWKRYGIVLCVTNNMQRLCHMLDMNFGGSWGTSSAIGKNERNRYLVSSLMEEAIFSSRMEGAATTREVAKRMLRGRITPRDKSQQMIANNYQTIEYVVAHRDEPLTKEALLQVHRLMTEKTLAHAEDAGRLRTNDDVVVEDGITHEVVHRPPTHGEIEAFVGDLCRYFNDDDAKLFVHPIIKGIVIHFMVAYMHPFVDGNGRTARALFYWYMLKQGYWLTEYLSISRVIAKSKKSYEKAFLYAEADENDIGYFVAYNLRVLSLSFKQLQSYLERKQAERAAAGVYMQKGHVNERQAQIIKMFVDKPNEVLTVKDVCSRFHVSPTTAKSDLVGLIEQGFVEEFSYNKVKRGYKKGAKV